MRKRENCAIIINILKTEKNIILNSYLSFQSDCSIIVAFTLVQ